MNSLESDKNIEIKSWRNPVLSDEAAMQICRIAEESFPPEERDPCQVLIRSIQKGKSILYTASEKNKIIGFTTLTPLKETGIYLMEYLAVDKNSRNLGIGGKILKFIKKDLSAPTDTGLILEVEPPGEVTGAEREIRLRRIRFYLRNGARMVLDGGAYRMPNLCGEGSLPMHLMWLPIIEGWKLPAALNLLQLFTLIFSETYPGKENEVLLNTIISKIPDKDTQIKLEESLEGNNLS
jgi:GNAT superfamily N-acetyltransferase